VQPLVSATRTADELSIVAPSSIVPEGAKAERDWRAFKVRGPLPFEITGVFSALSGDLAAAGIPIFVLSTYETDYLFVRGGDVRRAIGVLAASNDVEVSAFG